MDMVGWHVTRVGKRLMAGVKAACASRIPPSPPTPPEGLCLRGLGWRWTARPTTSHGCGLNRLAAQWLGRRQAFPPGPIGYAARALPSRPQSAQTSSFRMRSR